MKSICFFANKISEEDDKIIWAIMEQLGCNSGYEVKIFDMFVEDMDKFNGCDYGIAFGKRCFALATNKTKYLVQLPLLSNLKRSEENKGSRIEANRIIQEFKQQLSNPISVKNKTSEYQIINISPKKKICVYKDVVPTEVDALTFISEQQLELLLKAKEAFGAKSIVISGAEIKEEPKITSEAE